MAVIDNESPDQESESFLIESGLYTDEDVYQLELERIFGRSWLFVAHESMVPKEGDYITTFMAEDPVIVSRGNDGHIRVLLNKCLHRGNKVCLFDRGNAQRFRCSYHGWTYNNQGGLGSVPLLKDSYMGDLDIGEMSLPAPRVVNYKGLIFACWDKDVISLEDYLGQDFRWYLETFLLDADPLGLQVLPGRHRYMMPVNWKLLAENFGGDQYHFASTHSSVIAISQRPEAGRIVHSEHSGEHYSAEFTSEKHPPHGLLQLAVGEQFYQEDMNMANGLGAEAASWVANRHDRLQERLGDLKTRPYSFHTANVFPNLSMVGLATALYGRSLIVWQPRGPMRTEVWQWCFVERSAPDSVKERMAFTLTQRQAAAGMVAPDDHENFERTSDNLRGWEARSVPFHYGMGKNSGSTSVLPDLPGRVLPQISESYQRSFYRHWRKQMRQNV